MELSTRDRVALAAYTEIKEGRGTPRGGVWLDVSHLPRTQIMDRLPRVYQTLMDLQLLDITTTPIEIAPTAHYSMGGVWVRPEDHSTDVDGLYAIGEASSGLHGANRDLAHAFDLKASAIAARATLEAALERRETRGCHNRSDYPDLDEALNVNLVWSGPGRIKRETITVIPQDISGRMREVSTHGKLVE